MSCCESCEYGGPCEGDCFDDFEDACCDSCAQGGPCEGNMGGARMMAGVPNDRMRCPHCYAWADSPYCPTCGFDVYNYYSYGFLPGGRSYGVVPDASVKLGAWPPVDWEKYRWKKRYAPASVAGPCTKSYPRAAYYPRLPFQLRQRVAFGLERWPYATNDPNYHTGHSHPVDYPLDEAVDFGVLSPEQASAIKRTMAADPRRAVRGFGSRQGAMLRRIEPERIGIRRLRRG